MILKENSKVFVFGWNHDGQLGLGHNNDINKPTLLMGDVKQLQNNNQI